MQFIQNTKSVTRNPIILIFNIGTAVAQFVISYAAKYDKISANSYCGKLFMISKKIIYGIENYVKTLLLSFRIPKYRIINELIIRMHELDKKQRWLRLKDLVLIRYLIIKWPSSLHKIQLLGNEATIPRNALFLVFILYELYPVLKLIIVHHRTLSIKKLIWSKSPS